ncbi:unnamed protein product [Ilex paraguariensis]|uniref:Cyclin-D-binding Myb-like transcription factor 1 n=1 Tax=Ilex paraguariensis TaxID=185542 RepID=A0ABC8SMU4_9AQUA
MGKKSNKSKKYETGDLEQVTDSTDAISTGFGSNLNLHENFQGKKNKKRHEVGGDGELHGIHAKAVISKGAAKIEGDIEVEKGPRKKNRKSEFNEEVTDCTDGASVGVENNVRLNKEDEVKRKKKKKQEVGGDIGLNGIHDEAVNGMDFVEVDGDLQKDKDQKKEKKKRGLKSIEDKNKLNDVVGEWNRGLQTIDGADVGSDSVLKPRKNNKKNRKEKRKKDGSDTFSSSMKIVDNVIIGKDAVKGNRSPEKEGITEMKNWEEWAKEKEEEDEKRKDRNDIEDCDVEGKKKTQDGKEIGKSLNKYDANVAENFESKKRKKKKDKAQDSVAKNGNTGKRKVPEVDDSESPKGKGKLKKVRFSGHVEIFPLSDNPSTGKGKNWEDDLVRGKRFSREEDEIVKEAVLTYIEAHGLGEEGLDMVMHCGSHPETRNCWKEIGAAIPYRPPLAIYYRAHILFERDEQRKWTQDEYELIRKYQEKHGNDWKSLADELGKHRFHVKDTWRRIKLSNMKKGHWSQEEYQTLFDLVNADLQMRAFEEKKSKHGMLRDNIPWEAISDKLSTRINATCCRKWYTQLTSSMVAEGIWADTDDYRLLDELFKLDACCIEDVNWDELLDHRSGELCRKRWDQMGRHIGHHRNKSFADQVEILAKRYCPNLLEAREAWDSKPVVP